MSPSGGDRSAAFADVGSTAQRPSGVSFHTRLAYGTMSSQDSIKTAASESPSISAASGPISPPPDVSGAGAASSAAPPDDWGLEIGSSFPSPEHAKYVIKAEIEDGGMGVVYEAHQGELGVVAIKVIKPRILGQAASERFLNEARAMAKVRTEPGIATIFDCDWYTDTVTGTRAPFIVMEYVRGAMPITTYASEHQLGMRAKLELFQQVCEAMAAAHRADIIHRDLKPSNVMVDGSGNPKVIDFGLAMVRDAAEHSKRLPSERGGLFGTLEYMSPEQAAKRFDPHVLTAASDVYSLGVILYELLLGQLPYANPPGTAVKKSATGVADYSEATRIVREQAPVSPHKLNRAIHAGVEAILLKALEKDPAKRYKDAGELSEAIAGHLKWGRTRDIAAAVPIVVLAAWLAGLIAIPVFFFWTPVSAWYFRAAAAVAPPIREMERVVLVTVDEHTDPSKFGPLTVEDGRRLGFGIGERSRPLLGRLCEKLAKSECKVVALDWYYPANSPPETARDDDMMLVGAEALRANNIAWVMLSPEWQDRLENPPRVLTDSRAMLGSPWIFTESSLWAVEAALERDDVVMPSFSLMAAAAYKYEDSMFVFRLDNVSFGVLLTAVNNKTKKQTQDKAPLMVTHVVHGDASDAQRGHKLTTDFYTAKDRLALLALPPFPTDEAFERARVRANDLMQMSDAEAADHCRGKIVVIANRHEKLKKWEWALTPDGRELPKSYGHALAIEAFLQGDSSLRGADRYREIAATLLTSVLGIVVAARSGSPLRLVGVTAACVVGITGASLLLTRFTGAACNPIVPSVALLLAIGLHHTAPFAKRLVQRTSMAVFG